MDGVLIEKQCHGPAAVVPADEFEQDLELLSAPALFIEKERVAGVQIESAEGGAPRVEAGDEHRSGLSAARPALPAEEERAGDRFRPLREARSASAGP